MDLRVAVESLVEQTRDVMERLRTTEVEMLHRSDLHILQVQIYLLDKEIEKAKSSRPRKILKLPDFPPFGPTPDQRGQ